MRRISILLALVLVLAACGGGDDGGDTTAGTQAGNGGTTAATTAATTAETTQGTFVATGDFCEDADNNDTLVDGFDFLAGDLEAAINEWLEALEAAAAQAPNEIADDVAVFVQAANDFADVLADADYDFTAIDPNDPRILALDDGSLDEAAANIAEYCGWELPDPANGDAGGSGDTSGFGDDEIPADVPEALIPPNVIGVIDIGAGIVNLLVDGSYEDTVAFYTNAIGEPQSTVTGSTIYMGVVDGKSVQVIVDDTGDTGVVVNLIVIPG